MIVISTALAIALALLVWVVFENQRLRTELMATAEAARLPKGIHKSEPPTEPPNVTPSEKVGKRPLRQSEDSVVSRVHSRETALAYLDGILDFFLLGATLKEEEVPRVKILSELDLPQEARADFLATRERVRKTGGYWLAFRIFGSESLNFMEVPPFPFNRVTPEVLGYLTDDDLQRLQDRWAYQAVEGAAIQKAQAGRLGQKIKK